MGKSFAVAGLLAYKALSRKNGLSLCVSTGARAASEIIRKCVLFAEAVKKMTDGRIDYVPGHDHVNFTNGSRILSLPNNPAACRGFTAECVCLDEAAFIENLDDVIQAIAPTLTRNPDAEFVMTSTPAGKNGKFYELYQAALMDPEWEV